MAARGLHRKTLFPPKLVSCLQYRLFLSSKTFILWAISNEKKNSLKPQCWNVNENCDFDVAINHASYQSKKQQGKRVFLKFSFVFILGQSDLRVLIVLFFSILPTTTTKEKTLFASIRVELRALLSSRPPSRMRKVRSCKVGNLRACPCKNRPLKLSWKMDCLNFFRHKSTNICDERKWPSF